MKSPIKSVLFVSNFFTHHQRPFSDAMFSLYSNGYVFIETEAFSKERTQMGWRVETKPYVKQLEALAYEEWDKADFDAVIFGSAPRPILDCILKKGKPVFFCSERPFKRGYNYLKWPIRLIRFWHRYGRHRNMYLLCASAYTAADYAKHFTFRTKGYQWGYFPETIRYNVDALMRKKNRRKILWCGRFLFLKHPEMAVSVAQRLKEEGCDFELNLIGAGEMEPILEEIIRKKNLTQRVKLLGTMRPEQVRQYMEEAGVFLFTSDFREGWGAVLNESMNSGCAVVASHAIGAVPFMIKHGENGLVYQNGVEDDLYRKTKYLLNHPEEQVRLGTNAYDTITKVWNAEVAAERFQKMVEEIYKTGECDLYEEGPCSRAPLIRNNWFSAE